MSTPIQTNARDAPGPIVAPLLVGSLLEFLFFGVLVVQTYVYRVCFPNDQFAVKLLVHSVLLAMIVWICLSGAEVVFSLGTNFGDILVFKYSRNSYFLAHIMGALVATSTHLFFCYRILVISRAAWPLCIFIALISTLQCAGGTGAAILSHTQQYKVHVFYNAAGIHTPVHTILLYLWLICGALADILITCTMSFLLLKAAVTSNTRHLIKHVVQLTIEANAFSAATALVGLALFVALPQRTWFSCPVIILPGIYANTLLATLNNRAIMGLQDEESSTLQLSVSEWNTIDSTGDDMSGELGNEVNETDAR